MFHKPFTVTGLGGTICANENITTPLFKELNIENNINLHVIDWHHHFDALIGSSDLNAMGANIDYKTNTLHINNKSIPFIYEYSSAKVQPIVSQIHNQIQIPVSIENGDVILPEVTIGSKETIPECIATAKNGYCTLPVFDIDLPVEVNINERISVTPLCEAEIIKNPITKSNKPFHINDHIRVSHLNNEEKRRILDLCQKYKDVFYREDCDLTFTNAVKHRIITTDEEPVFVKPYRYPHAMKEEIHRQVKTLLDSKMIRPSVSPYSSPVWVVPKKLDASGERKFRMVIDYRKLNEKTVEDRYPIPRIDEILDNLGKSTYYSTLDLAQGFHQVEMDEKSIEKTAFSADGHWEYLRMPYGLKNSPRTFQRVMDNVLKEYLNKFLFVYLDDIVVFSKSLDEHIQHLTLVFKRLREYNLKAQLHKCEFLRKEVEYLGHVITPDGIKPNPGKIEAIVKYPIPKTVKEIKQFLGLIGYYRRFCMGFAKLVQPMTKCLKKNAKIDIKDPEYIRAFDTCKELLTNAPILAYPDFEKPFTLTTDASNVALGSVLSQNNRPIAYYSRTLNSAEKNYSTIEKELLAILASVRHFRPYLYGRHFTIFTDHNPLCWLYKIKEPNSRLVRWKLKLDEYQFDIQYKKGRENSVADALSRIEINHLQKGKEPADQMSMVPNVDEEPPTLSDEDLDRIMNSQIADNDLQQILRELESAGEGSQNNTSPHQRNTPPNIITDMEVDPHIGEGHEPDADPLDDNESDATVHSTDGDTGKGLPITEQAVNIYKNRIILRLGEFSKRRITRPFDRHNYIITINPESIIENLTETLKEIIRPDLCYGIYCYNEELKKPLMEIVKDTFNDSVKLFLSNKYCLDVINEESQDEIVTEYHEKNHNGITETINHLKGKYYWPNMKTTVTNFINHCDTCLQAKYERHPYNLKFSGPLLAKRPFDIIHCDTFSFQGSNFLTIIDLFSRYAQAYHLDDKTGVTILKKLRHFFGHHNVPQKIVTDPGKEFKNKVVQEFCRMNKVELHFTTVNNPSSNSPIERFHSTIVEKLRTLRIKNPRDTPENLMISAVFIYNSSIHSATNFAPFDLLYGPYERNIEFDLDMTLYEQYNEKRKQEILPFYNQVYNKNKNRAERTLNKRNEPRMDPPDLTNKEVYIERDRPRKADPPFEKLKVTAQNKGTLIGLSQKNRETTAHIGKAKRLRHTIGLQSPTPGPSRLAVVDTRSDSDQSEN